MGGPGSHSVQSLGTPVRNIAILATVLATAAAMVGLAATRSTATGSTGTTVQSVSGSAYGESINLTTLLGIHVSSGPLPTVSLPPGGGGPFTNSVLSVAVPNLLSAGVMPVSTQGATGPSGSATSNASTANAKVGGGTNPTLLTAELLTSSCTSSAAGSTGSASVVNLAILGQPVINGALTPNQTITLLGIGKVILDEQIESSSATGSSITVNTVHVALNGLLGTGDIIISQSHCDVTLVPLAPQTAVFVAYADNYNGRPTTFFPTPWQGSPNVVFVGGPSTDSTDNPCNTEPNQCWDTGGVRVDNQGASAITVHITVDIGTNHYDLWGDQSVGSGQTLIVAQTGNFNFDGSDTQPVCTPSGEIPVVHVTVNGVTTDFHDNGQVLDTGGVDRSFCPSGTNEGQDWSQITS